MYEAETKHRLLLKSKQKHLTTTHGEVLSLTMRFNVYCTYLSKERGPLAIV